MKPYTIDNQEDLKAYINQLKSQSSNQKKVLTDSYSKLNKLFSVGNVLKQTTDLAPVRNVKNDLSKAGLNVGSELLINRIWGRHTNIGSFVAAFALRRVINQLINKVNVIAIFKNLKNKFQN